MTEIDYIKYWKEEGQAKHAASVPTGNIISLLDKLMELQFQNGQGAAMATLDIVTWEQAEAQQRHYEQKAGVNMRTAWTQLNEALKRVTNEVK